jgi:hypothetical protein
MSSRRAASMRGLPLSTRHSGFSSVTTEAPFADQREAAGSFSFSPQGGGGLFSLSLSLSASRRIALLPSALWLCRCRLGSSIYSGCCHLQARTCWLFITTSGSAAHVRSHPNSAILQSESTLQMFTQPRRAHCCYAVAHRLRPSSRAGAAESRVSARPRRSPVSLHSYRPCTSVLPNASDPYPGPAG